jgi:hypothetical protein
MTVLGGSEKSTWPLTFSRLGGRTTVLGASTALLTFGAAG